MSLVFLISGCAQILGNVPVEPPKGSGQLSISINKLPAEVSVGRTIDAVIGARGGAGRGYTWQLDGELPAGLNFVPAAKSATITGIPQTPGNFALTLNLFDESGALAQEIIAFRVKPVILEPSSLTRAKVERFYTQDITAAGDDFAYTWSIASGLLPSGLNIVGNGKIATISGVTIVDGDYTFTVRAAVPNDTTLFAEKSYRLKVEASDDLGFTPGDQLPPMRVGQFYRTVLTPHGGTVKDYTWWGSCHGAYAGNAAPQFVKYFELQGKGGGVIPMHMKAGSGDDLVICGVPQEAGDFALQYDIWLWDDSQNTIFSGNGAAIKIFALTVEPALSFGFETLESLGNAAIDKDYEQELVVSGGDPNGTYTWRIINNAFDGVLPDGLVLNAHGTTAMIEGKPTMPLQLTSEPYKFVIEVSDGTDTCARVFKLKLVDPAQASQTPTILDPTGGPGIDAPLAARGGEHFSFNLEAIDGYGQLTWEVLTPTSWLSIGSSGGAICTVEGTAPIPTQLGPGPDTYSVTIRVSTPGGESDEITLTIFIDIVPTIDNATLPDVTVGESLTVNMTASGIWQANLPMSRWAITRITTPSLHPSNWLSIDAVTGVLSGTPLLQDVAASVEVEIQVIDTDRHAPSYPPDNRAIASRSYSFAVMPIPSTLAIEGVDFGTAAYAGEWVCGQLQASGGTPPYTWSMTSGAALPSGWQLDASRGMIYGLAGIRTAGQLQLNMSVTDATNTTVSRVVNATILPVPAPGTIITVAGGISGSLNDNVPARLAHFGIQSGWYNGITLDRSGNLYFTAGDGQEGRVYKIDAATGVVRIIAGSGQTTGNTDNDVPATSAPMEPVDVAVDYVGNIYILDYRSGKIRWVSATTGLIRDSIGTGDYHATADKVSCIETFRDSSNRDWVYVASAGAVASGMDGSAQVLRYQMDGAGSYTTSEVVAGTKTGHFNTSYLGAPARNASIDAGACIGIALNAQGDLYISAKSSIESPGKHRLFKVNASNNILSSAFESEDAGVFFADAHLCTDAQGNVFICPYDATSGVYRWEQSSGNVTTVAGGDMGGDGGPALSSRVDPLDVTMDAQGNLYILTVVGGVGVRKVIGVNSSRPVISLTAGEPIREPKNHAANALGSFTLDVRTIATRSSSITVTLENVPGSATSGTDFAPIQSSVTIPPSSNAVDVPVTVYGDGIRERGEFIGLRIVSVSSNAVADPAASSAALAILDADGGLHDGFDFDGDGNNDVAFMGSGGRNGSYTERGGLFVMQSDTLAATNFLGDTKPSDGNFLPSLSTGSAWTPAFSDAIQNIGDFNGDGVDDIAFHTFSPSTTDTDSYLRMEIDIIYGGASRMQGTLSATDIGTRILFDRVGNPSGYYYSAAGKKIAGIGDINGDGIDDFAFVDSDYITLGSYDHDNDPNTALMSKITSYGRVLVYFGSQNPVATRDGNQPDVAIEYTPTTEQYHWLNNSYVYTLGTFVQGNIDLNADGYDDILVGEKASSGAGTQTTRTYTAYGIYGGPEVAPKYALRQWDSRSALYAPPADLRLSIRQGNPTKDVSLGTGGVAVGDVNGDGYQDIAFGEATPSSSGAIYASVYLFLGPVAQNPGFDYAISSNAAMLGYFGHHVAIGDFNGDGYDDIATSELGRAPDPLYDPVGSRAKVRIFSGSSTWTNTGSGTLIAYTDATTSISLETPVSGAIFQTYSAEQAGTPEALKVAFLGDLNGDHCDDLLLSTPNANIRLPSGTQRLKAGGGMLFFGGANRTGTLDALATADKVFVGDIAYNSLGSTIIGK